MDDRVRRHLRDLLYGLSTQEARGEGAEYRWGETLLLEASRGARQACQVIEDILHDRCHPSLATGCWPAQRVPAYGARRSRVSARTAASSYSLTTWKCGRGKTCLCCLTLGRAVLPEIEVARGLVHR